ncbi:MAG: hypothetical protein CML19_12165 [Pusillimonas sp.]|nr:hypothetical protein [Pusillimonas sp.]
MSYVAAAIVAGTAISAYGSVKAGKAAKQEANFNAAQMERDMELGRIEATQNATAMSQDYAQSVSANDAFFAFAGRDVTDRSVRAFMDRQEEIYNTDIARLASDTNMRAQSVAAMAGAERQRGRNALTAGYLGAAQTIAGGIYQAGTTKTGVPMDSQSRQLTLSKPAGSGVKGSLNSTTRTSSGYRRYLRNS